MAHGLLFGREAIGVEPIGVRPHGGVEVDAVGADERERPRRVFLAQELHRLEAAPHEEHQRRVQAQRLLEDAGRVRELLGREGVGPLRGEGVGLGLYARPRLRVLAEEVERPRERVCRGLVPRHEERRRLVADLLVAHPLAAPALAVAREEQAREQIGALPRIGPTLVDERLQPSVHEAYRGDERRVVTPWEEHGAAQRLLDAVPQVHEGRRHVGVGLLEPFDEGDLQREERGGEMRVDPLQGDGERLAELLRLGVGVGAEQRARHDPHRDARHLVREIDRRPVLHAREGAQGHGVHRARIAGELARVEQGRRQATLPPPQLALAREEPLAREVVQEDPEAGRLLERARVLDQDRVRRLRRARDEHLAVQETDARQGPRRSSRAQEREAIFLEQVPVAEKVATGDRGDRRAVHARLRVA